MRVHRTALRHLVVSTPNVESVEIEDGRIGELTKVQSDWREGPAGSGTQSRVSNLNEVLDKVRSLLRRDDESRSQGEDDQEAHPAQRLQSQLRDAWAQMGNRQNNMRGQITRALSNESYQAIDGGSSPSDSTSRAVAAVFTTHTCSGVRVRIRCHDTMMDQTAFEVDQCLWSEEDEQLIRLSRTTRSRCTSRKRAVNVLTHAVGLDGARPFGNQIPARSIRAVS